MQCLLTGATGFIGGWMAERLVRAGMRVRCLVRSGAGLANPALELCIGSLFEPQALRRALSDVEYVLHFAGITRALRSRDYFRVNGEGSEALYTAIRQAAPQVKRVVHISSQAAAGPALDGRPLDEGCVPHPITAYGRSKLAGEEAARRSMQDLPIVILRPPVVYGPRDRSGLSLFKSAARGYRVSVRGCAPCFSPIFVEDLVEAAFTAMIAGGAAGRTYFVTGSEAIRASALTAMLARLSAAEGRDVVIPYSLARLAVMALEVKARISGRPNKLNSAKLKELRHEWLASNARIRDELGFAPKTTLENGLRTTLEWYRSAGWL